MKIELEIIGELWCWIIRANGKEFKSESTSSKELLDLWASILEAEIIDEADDERGIYNEDSIYPCAIYDVVWTEHVLNQDGYSAGLE